MGYWYDGNLNLAPNRHEVRAADGAEGTDGAVFYVRGVREVNNTRYERYAVATHFIECGEDYIEVLRRYVTPLYRPGDIVSLSEKVISMCQRNTVEKRDVKVGFWARHLSKFATSNDNGIGMDEPYKLQLAINLKGLPLVLWAAGCGAAARVFGRRGVFYKIVGPDVAGIDGFYSHSAFERYHSLAVLVPREPDRVCAEIEEKLGIASIIVDANDADVIILGRAPSLRGKGDAFLADIIRDNPAGQDDELTPFVLVRNIGDAPAMDYTPPAPREEKAEMPNAEAGVSADTEETAEAAAGEPDLDEAAGAEKTGAVMQNT